MARSESLLFNQIATDLYSAEGILAEIQAQKAKPDARPRTTSGEVDLGASPPPDQGTLDRAGDVVAPRTPVEKKLVEIWAELLHLDSVSIHDNFFSLGGHSLLAMQVLARVHDVFQVELPLQILFTDAFTITDLAEAIQEHQRTRPDFPAGAAREETPALTDQEARSLIEQADTKELAALLEELDGMSEDELALLAGPG